MAENTKISWATHSFSPWIGCSKVHAGCANCYAEAMSGRLGVKWGPQGTRRRTAESTWRQVEKWNRTAGEERSDAIAEFETLGPLPANIVASPRVFPSLCDPFEDWGGPILGSNGRPIYIPLCDNPAPNDAADHRQLTMADVRRDFFALIDRCQNLDFLLLTKRPENIRKMWPELIDKWPAGPWRRAGDQFRRNIWLLYSASDQQTLEACYGHLRICRELVPVLGLSLEPLVGAIDFAAAKLHMLHDVDWVIVGGESGPNARPMEISWLESIADQCDAAGVPLFVKQDSGRKAGQQGRIPDRLWARKEFPHVDRR